MENSSREFTHPMVREMISRQQKEYQWQFTFLAANEALSNKVARMRQQAALGEAILHEFTPQERRSME